MQDSEPETRHERYLPILLRALEALDARASRSEQGVREIRGEAACSQPLLQVWLDEFVRSACQSADTRAPRAEVLAAIDRIGTGDFGWCRQCDEFIGLGLLDRDPLRELCRQCET
ncbi:MAG: hypothetical protein IBX58_16490 [Roseovarius sp.]|nr:hypothetical protein [Roseovarius sp.]